MIYQKKLIELFEKWEKEKSISFTPLPESGSNRKYFRITSKNKSAIGVFNPDKRENQAFIFLSKHFIKSGLNVPQIYSTLLSYNIFLIEDLGDTTLFSLIINSTNGLSDEQLSLIKKSLAELGKFQIVGSRNLDYSKCYPRSTFDTQSIMWDLNYFKYYFLKLTGINFDEQKLEDDFNTLAKYLAKVDNNFFMYRDFNSRNIMIKENQLYFIDYQGGRKGPLQYDVASFLYSSKLNFDEELRDELLKHYLESVSVYKKVNKKEFLNYYYDFALIRILQMLGAYGFRGYYEGKAHFITSIPFAIKNLRNVLDKVKIKQNLPELKKCLNEIINSDKFSQLTKADGKKNKLTVRINSFSYRDKIPTDFTGNGGGFVFDCRAIPNPGRLEKYRTLTGKDLQVQRFLETQPEVNRFLKESFDIVEQSVTNYLKRGWTDLMVNYGCTGGQHRSVYCAEKLAEYLKGKYDIDIVLSHTKLIQ